MKVSVSPTVSAVFRSVLRAIPALIVLIGLFMVSAPMYSQEQGAQAREDALQAFREGRYQDAIRITNREIDSTPGNMDSYAVQGWTLLALGRWADAVDLAQRGLQVSRYDHRVIAIMGEAQYQLGNNLAALQYLQEYTAIRPDGAIIDEVYRQMAEVYMRLGEYHSADIAYTTALYYDSSQAQWWYRLGLAREQGGNDALALEAYEQAVSIDPNLTDANEAVERLSI